MRPKIAFFFSLKNKINAACIMPFFWIFIWIFIWMQKYWLTGFFLSDFAYFALTNLYTMHVTTFSNYRVKIFYFGKCKNISFNPQLVYTRHFKKRIWKHQTIIWISNNKLLPVFWKSICIFIIVYRNPYKRVNALCNYQPPVF